MEPPVIYSPNAHAALLPSIIALHQACITSPPYTIASFLPPLSYNEMHNWWSARIEEQSQGGRKLILQLALNDKTGAEEVAGYVMLSMPESQTGPFRGIVEKLLVSPEYRRRGIARRLMEALEGVAKEHGRTLLLLDTETGSPAETVYSKLGYITVGTIPDYGISPADRSLKAGTFFYKIL